MATTASWGSAPMTRSRIALEIACHLVAAKDQPLRQAKILLREQGGKDYPSWSKALFASSTVEGIHEVAERKASLAIVNPSALLTLAYRGTGQFKAPLPLRMIAVVPTLDQYVFAVHPDTGLQSVEDILAKRYRLKIALRGQADHAVHSMLDDVLAAAGFSLQDIASWGGEFRREGILPYIDGPKFHAIKTGEINAIFDEGANSWVREALAAGLRILPLAETTVRKLEAMGYRRGVIQKSRFAGLANDVLTLDFSGWAIFTHADEPDALVGEICAGLDARKELIPWSGDGPLPVERMCIDSPETPIDVPFHPAAERFWRAKGYIR